MVSFGIIGKFSSKNYTCFQVNVQMEYSRNVGPANGSAVPAGAPEARTMDFGSVFLLSTSKAEGDVAPSAVASAGSQQTGVNVAELVVGRGFGTVVRHRDFEERSNYYDTLLAAESRAISARKGIHSAKDPPVMHITDLTTVRNLMIVQNFNFSITYSKNYF
jgi:staphylococcal nuclease domain-containing protein 1